MSVATKTYRKKAWAVVTPRGRVQLDTICYDRESALNFYSEHDKEIGNKVARVTVTCDWQAKT